ncbi:hypothetical protein [Kitasatospora nipponensis]|uniref:hypothetical protein n=1 Tax=Kitasatospora nipponensis TaxID=258049 RepID=UPI0031CFD371
MGVSRSAFRSAAAVVGAALLVGGCSSARYPGPQGLPGGRTSTPAPTGTGSAGGALGSLGGTPSDDPTPSPLPTPYGIQLTTWVGPVNTALGQVGKAGSLDSLSTALGTAQQAASAAATGLQGAVPPDSLSDANRKLYVALDQLATDLGQVQSDITASKVCATSSALAETGGVQGLKDVPAALQTLAASGYTTDFAVPQTPQQQHRALDNGAFVREGQDDGNGELTVENGGDADAVLTLTKSGTTAYSFYVVKGKTAKVTGIRDGNYDVYFTGGFDWDAGTKQFTQSCDFTKFDDGLDFTTTSSTYSTWKVSLQPVAGGNATTTQVPPGSFPVP